MLNDAIQTAYYAFVTWKKALIGSHDEKMCFYLKQLACENLKDNSRSFDEYMRLRNHIDYLSDRTVWKSLYCNVDSLHVSINRKA